MLTHSTIANTVAKHSSSILKTTVFAYVVFNAHAYLQYRTGMKRVQEQYDKATDQLTEILAEEMRRRPEATAEYRKLYPDMPWPSI